ncbi:hypothetical protein ABW19_dt0206707 [Dactylella cylindrospora]|nr:hypothetical protein ABW19_dt0206707 [Dactylella cylindrospora]
MRFISFLLATCLALLPSFVLGERNAFTAPLLNDLVTAGQTFQIRWINLDGGIINLVLRRGNPANLQTIGAIATGISNNGVFNWNVPSDLTPGNDYAIEIQFGAARNYTPLFTIISGPYPVPYPSSRISGSTPTSSGTSTSFIEKVTSGEALTASYPDPTATITSMDTETMLDISETLIYPSPTTQVSATSTNEYSTLTLVYGSTLATVINGSATTYITNSTLTTSTLVTPTGNMASGIQFSFAGPVFLFAAAILVLA